MFLNVFEVVDPHNCLKNSRTVIEVIFVLRIIRIFRIFHLVKHYKALQILVHAIRASVQELLMLSIFLLIAMLVFSTLIFYAERRCDFDSHQELNDTTHCGGMFETIPVGFWWSIITMTTVGYGDVYPVSKMGRVVGAICAVCGVMLVALTIPVMSNNFALFYVHARTRENFGKEKRTAAQVAHATVVVEELSLPQVFVVEAQVTADGEVTSKAGPVEMTTMRMPTALADGGETPRKMMADVETWSSLSEIQLTDAIQRNGRKCSDTTLNETVVEIPRSSS